MIRHRSRRVLAAIRRDVGSVGDVPIQADEPVACRFLYGVFAETHRGALLTLFPVRGECGGTRRSKRLVPGSVTNLAIGLKEAPICDEALHLVGERLAVVLRGRCVDVAAQRQHMVVPSGFLERDAPAETRLVFVVAAAIRLWRRLRF